MIRDALIQEFVKAGCEIIKDETGYIVLDGRKKISEVFITVGGNDNPNDDTGITIFGNGFIEINDEDNGATSMILNNVLFRDISRIKYIYITLIDEF